MRCAERNEWTEIKQILRATGEELGRRRVFSVEVHRLENEGIPMEGWKQKGREKVRGTLKVDCKPCSKEESRRRSAKSRQLGHRNWRSGGMRKKFSNGGVAAWLTRGAGRRHCTRKKCAERG